MPVVPPELGVGAFERWVSEGLRLLNSINDDNQHPSILKISQAAVLEGVHVPVLVRFLGLIVLGRVFGFCYQFSHLVSDK
jgi:hypothetical protein